MLMRSRCYNKLVASLLVSTSRRRFCSSNSGGGGGEDKMIASVLFERLPVIIPKIDPVVYAFQEFSFRWGQQYRREYPEAFLKKSDNRGKGDYHIDYVPAPRVTEADRTNDKNYSLDTYQQVVARLPRSPISHEIYVCCSAVEVVLRSLKRALDRRLYLLMYGNTYGDPKKEPVWHFPEKVYESEETMRKCAESALKSVIGDLSHAYFVGNAPMGHVVMQPFKRFFFKSQVISTNEFDIRNCEDFVWVTKDELLEYFPEQAEYLNRMIIS